MGGMRCLLIHGILFATMVFLARPSRHPHASITCFDESIAVTRHAHGTGADSGSYPHLGAPARPPPDTGGETSTPAGAG